MIIIVIMALPKPSACIYNFPPHGTHFVSIVLDFYNSLALLGENKEQIQDGTFLPPSGIGKVDCQRVGGGFQAVFKLLVKDIWAQNRYGCCSTPQPHLSCTQTHLHARTHTECCARTEAGGSPWLQLHDNMPLEIAGLLINPADMTASPRGLAL